MFMILEHLLPKLSSISFHAFLFVCSCFNICILFHNCCCLQKIKKQAYIEELFIAKILRRKSLDSLEVYLKL